MTKKYLLIALLVLTGITTLQAQRRRAVSPYSPEVAEIYNSIDGRQAAVMEEKPLIGIAGDESANPLYVELVIRNGGVPYLIPATDDVDVLRQIASELDGIVFTGSDDLAMFKLATDRNVPALGVAGGLELISRGMGTSDYRFRPVFAAEAGSDVDRNIRSLVAEAEVYQEAKEIHTRILSVDTHTDTPLWFSGGYSVGLRKSNQVSIQKMEEGGLDAQFLAAFLSQGERDEASLQKAVEKCESLIKGIYADVEKYPEACGVAITADDARRLKAEGKKAFFIGIENGYGIGKDIKNIRKFKDMGVNYITLCHSYDNDICNSSTNTADAGKGLTDFGRKVVREMNKVGVLIDLSHASEGTFWDVVKLSKDPVFASHSGVKTLCGSDRNLTDEQLRALAQNGGVIQVCIFRNYQNDIPEEASVIDVVRHIDHAVKVAGIDHVGIGSDFDGGGGVLGCNGDNDMINITVNLLKMGYGEEDLYKIWGGNFFRILDEVR